MTEKEKEVLVKEKKQLQAFIDCLRGENDAIGVKLTGMIESVAEIRENQLGIDLILRELQTKLHPPLKIK